MACRNLLLVGGFGSVALVDACSVGSEDLCGCSELISAKLIGSFDECTQSAAVAACKSGECAHLAHAVASEAPAKLPFSFHDDIGPFDMSWGFPSDDTIEIEYSLPSDFYTGIGLTADGVGDTVAGWIDESGQVHVRDYYDEGSRQPLTDEEKGCKNDVEAVSGSYEDGITTIRFRRKLNTGDGKDCDAVITKGPMDINYAWCDSRFCFQFRQGCLGDLDGCIDSPHGPDAINIVTVDFSGNSVGLSV